MKVLDAGQQLLDDRDVLNFIHDKQKQHAAADAATKASGLPANKRPANFERALKKHAEHLESPDRPFLHNARYDVNAQYLTTLLGALEPRAQLTKTELLMLVNHRPHKRELLLPMIEDVDARYSEDEQQWIVDTVAETLGMPGGRGGDEGADGGREVGKEVDG